MPRNSGIAIYLLLEPSCKEPCTRLDPIESEAALASVSTRCARNLLLKLVLPLSWQQFVKTK